MNLESANLSQYLIPETDEVFYIPEFIGPEEEEFVLRKACPTALSKAP